MIAIGLPALEPVAAVYADRKAATLARRGAANVLGTLGEPAVAPLARTIEKGADAYEDNASFDTTSIAAGVAALGKIGTPSAEKALIRFIDDFHPFAYDDAVQALAVNKTDEHMHVLLGLMKNCGDPAHCQPIGEALAGFGAAAEPHLLVQLRDGGWDDSGPRSASAVAIGQIGSDKGIETMIGVLRAERDNDLQDVYDAVAEALARSANAKARAFVDERVAKRDYRFIASAYYPLKERIDAKLIVDALNEEGDFFMASFLINDPNPVLRKAARRWAEDHGHTVTEWTPGKTITP